MQYQSGVYQGGAAAGGAARGAVYQGPLGGTLAAGGGAVGAAGAGGGFAGGRGGGVVYQGPMGGQAAMGGGMVVAGSGSGGGSAAGCCGGGSGGGAGGCGTSCGVAGCGADCSVASGPATMTFVGDGAGEYIVSTEYKYVGRGAGIYSMVAPRKSYLGVVACVTATLLLALLLFLLWPRTTSTTTPMTTTWQPPTTIPPTTPAPPRPIRECLFWGDPHIHTFDGATPSFYGSGEFWIVKSEQVHIQGRYLGTDWTHGLAATNKLMLGGPFLKGHTITVETTEDNGQIMVDGHPVLESLGSTYNIHGLASLSYSGSGELVDAAQTEFPKRIVQMHLPENVKISVMRWPNYLDLKIEMQQQPTQDGSCGNFNGVAADDTSEAIIRRIGARVPASDLLFHTQAPETLTMEMQKMLAEECRGETLRTAERDCRGNAHPDNCKFDVCFGMNPHARKEALTFAN